MFARCEERFRSFYTRDVQTYAVFYEELLGFAMREPEDMPWGERVAFAADPDGNPVTLAAPVQST